MSITFVAVICEADDPCSVNTAYEPEPSFTMSPRSATRPLFFLKLCFQLRIIEMTKIHPWRKMNSNGPWSLLQRSPHFCFWTFVSCHAVFSPIFPFFLHCCLCFWHFHGFRHRNKFVHKIIVTPMNSRLFLRCALHVSCSETLPCVSS